MMLKRDTTARSQGFITALLLVTATGPASAAEWRIPDGAPLLTRWAKDVGPDNALPEYPRPQMRRKEWMNLNGLWDYAITGKSDENIPAKFAGGILVPFPIESALSGVMQPLKPDQRLWYRRRFSIPDDWASRRILLHFGAVDWQATVFLNGRELGSHRGGYDAFTFDITKALKPGGIQWRQPSLPGEPVVSVGEATDASWQLHGKQTLHPAGCPRSCLRQDAGTLAPATG